MLFKKKADVVANLYTDICKPEFKTQSKREREQSCSALWEQFQQAFTSGSMQTWLHYEETCVALDNSYILRHSSVFLF